MGYSSIYLGFSIARGAEDSIAKPEPTTTNFCTKLGQHVPHTLSEIFVQDNTRKDVREVRYGVLINIYWI